MPTRPLGHGPGARPGPAGATCYAVARTLFTGPTRCIRYAS